MKMSGRNIVIAGIILVAALSRLLPHLPNFTPIAAMAIFGGVMIRNKKLAFILPLLAMLISDVLLELVYGQGFYNTQWSVYFGFAAIVLIGRVFGDKLNVGRISGAALTGSTAFFLITNFGAWIGSPYYPQSFTGLMMSYTAGIPFFGYSLLGDLFYTGLLFGGWALLKNQVPALQAIRKD